MRRSTAHLVYSSLYSVNRAVERYTADTHPTTGLQSYTAYTALYTIQLYSLYIIQHYTITLWTHSCSTGVEAFKPSDKIRAYFALRSLNIRRDE